MSDDAGFMSYKNSQTAVSETVSRFLYGMLCGTAWGLVDPFGPVEAGQPFRPSPLFRNLSSIPTNAIVFGSILGWQQLNARSMELLRRQDDIWNDAFGMGMVYPYYRYILQHSERRFLLHNRIVGSGFVVMCAYGMFFA